MVGLELTFRKKFAKDLGVCLESARGESRRTIEVLFEMSALVKVTAGSRLGVATPVTAGVRLVVPFRRVP